jgi:uncharacterized protein YdeI (YjbR/CyaY-like superfamily)
MPLKKDLQKQANVVPGNVVQVTMEMDEPQAKGLPQDFAHALANAPAAKQFFETLTVFYRNEHIHWIEEAKKTETRTARLDEAITMLKTGKKQRP